MADQFDVILVAATVLSAATAFVAALSAESSKRAVTKLQERALSAWQKTADASEIANSLSQASAEKKARRARRKYGHVLKRWANEKLWLWADSSQRNPDTIAAGAGEINRLTGELDEISVSDLFIWAFQMVNDVKLHGADMPTILAHATVLDRRVDRWVLNPESEGQVIRGEQRLAALERRLAMMDQEV